MRGFLYSTLLIPGVIAAVLAMFIIICGVAAFEWWGLAQPLALYLSWRLAGIFREGNASACPKGRYLKVGLIGGLLGFVLCIVVACFQTDEFSNNWGNWVNRFYDAPKIIRTTAQDIKNHRLLDRWTVDEQMKALQRRGVQLLIARGVLDGGADFALRGASICVFLLFSYEQIQKRRRVAV